MRVGLLAAMLAMAAPSNAFAQPSAAPGDQSSWTHSASGATFPRRFNDMSISETRDLGSSWNSVLIYDGGGSGVESVTIYVFRAAFPDARLWFERAMPALARDIPLNIFEEGPETPFSAFGAASANGVFRIFHTTRPGPFRTTALATAQAGPWIVKIRYSSASLDPGAMASRLAALGAAIRFPDTAAAAPLSARIADCTGTPVDGTGSPAAVDEENLAAVTVGTLRHAAAFRQPLADTASSWCRDAGFPAERGTLLRRVEDPQYWVLLIGDAGQAIVAIAGAQMRLPEQRWSVVLAVTPASLRVAALFEGTPPMMQALQAAAPVLSGRSDGLLEIGSDREPARR